MGFQSLIEDGQPQSYLFRTLIRDQRKKKTSKITYPDMRELLFYIQDLEKENKKLQRYEAEYKISKKREDVTKKYIIKVMPLRGNNPTFTKEGYFVDMISVIKTLGEFKENEIKYFERTLATYGYLFCETKFQNISVLEET